MAVFWPFLANFQLISSTKLRFRRSFWGAEQVSKVTTQNANGAVTNRQENTQLFSEGSLIVQLQTLFFILSLAFSQKKWDDVACHAYTFQAINFLWFFDMVFIRFFFALSASIFVVVYIFFHLVRWTSCLDSMILLKQIAVKVS